MNSQPSKVCKRRSPPSKLSGVQHQLFILLYLRNSWTKHKGFCHEELLVLWFLVIQVFFGSRHSSLLHNKNKIFFSSIFYTKRPVKQMHSHDSQRAERRGSTFSPQGRGASASLVCTIKGSAHASGQYVAHHLSRHCCLAPRAASNTLHN